MVTGFDSQAFHQTYSLIAQSVERRTVNPQVGGSSPPRGANNWRSDMSGKGSSPRPYSVPLETFNNNFDAIFRKEPLEVTEQEEEAWQELENKSSKKDRENS